MTVNALMKNVGEKYDIQELQQPRVQPNFITTLVEAAIEKQENDDYEVCDCLVLFVKVLRSVAEIVQKAHTAAI